jgi:1,4-dihydroxy-2-naphthoyl-CoA hydrolase
MDHTDHTGLMNQTAGGFNRALGLVFTKATADEVAAELTVGPQHLQPYGVVHGGVYCAMIETLSSAGAAITAMAQGMSVVGLENSTSFIRAVREGKLHAVARPLLRGRRSHVWEATITDDAGKVCATGRVRLICLEQGAEVAGRKAAVEG